MLALPFGCVIFALAWLARGRCPHTLYLQAHDLMHPRRKRRADGQVIPGILEYECRRCSQVVGETEYKPSWSLLAKIRRQIPFARERSRRVA